jgi:glycerophosphoryl diester phosphodiesterase
MKILGHRGSAGTALENTMEAMQHGWESGADGIEVDVHLSADNHVVVHHDKTTKRLCDKNVAIKSSTLAELENIRLRDQEHCEHPIPTLAQTFGEIAKQSVKKDFFIEVKSGKKAIKKIAEILPADAAEFVTIISFRADVIREAKALLPEVRALFLVDSKLGVKFSTSIITKAKACNADGLGVNYKALIPAVAAAIKAEGMHLNIWTMNNEFRLREFADMGVDTCTTDFPKDFTQLFKSELH